MNLIYYFLVMLYSLLLPLHIVNTMEIGGGLKLFYIPVGFLCLYNAYHIKEFLQDKVLINMLKIGCLSLLPVLVFGAPFGSFVKYMLIFFSLLGLPFIEKKYIFALSPFFLIFANVWAYRYSTWPGLPWRYQGMYNDPNYYVISIIVGIYLCLRAFEYPYEKILIKYSVKVASILSILISLYVILLTQSRGGILAFVLFVTLYIPRFYKQYPKITIFILIALFVGSGSLYVRFSDSFNAITSRFMGEKQADVNGANSRITEINLAVESIESMPFYLIFGAGISASGDDESEYQNNHRIHNTPVAVIYENGLYALFLLISAFWIQIKKTYKRDNLSLALLLAISLQSLTIWTITYIPFWLGLVLTIESDYYENEVESYLIET